MITISESAKEFIERTMKNEDPSKNLVRVGVKGGGCSGLQYELKFESETRENDQLFEDKGIKLVIELKSLMYLFGTELDYSGGLNGKGLYFNNPNASKTCACGESFAV